VIRSCRPVISSQVKEHLPLHRSRSIRCIDRVTFALPPMIPLPEGSISNRVTGEPHLFQFQRLSPIEVGSNANIRFQRNRFLGNLGHCVFEDFDAFLFRSMNRYCEGAANQSHFSEKSIGLEISSCSFIPSFKESEMAWQQA